MFHLRILSGSREAYASLLTNGMALGLLLRHKAGQEGRGEILLENSFMR